RVPRKISIVAPRSQCPHCHAVLKPQDLIPVFSWLCSKGRCRYCHAIIGVRYLVIELVTAASVTAAFVLIGFKPELIVAVLAIVAFITLATINFEKGV
ncbi:MAG: A24 family peptidase, partial [Bdellovibrionales bacterium]